MLTKKLCPTCSKTAISEKEYKIGTKLVLRLKCGHIIQKEQLGKCSPEDFTSHDGKKLFPFQNEGVRFLEESSGRALVADEMGLGKTVQALVTLGLHKDELLPALFIVKSSLKVQWQHEMVRWNGLDMIAQIIPDSRTPLLPGLQAYIISFDLIPQFNDCKCGHPKSHHRKTTTKKEEGCRSCSIPEQQCLFYVESDAKRLKDMITQRGIKTIVIDEVQQIKNMEAKRTKEVRAICAGIEHVIALSGTPIKNNAAEYFPILNILQPERFPSFARFIQRDCNSYHNGYGYKIGGLADPEEFREKTKDFIIRRERAEVLPELPQVTRNFSFHELAEEVEKAYADAFKQFAEEYDDEEMSSLVAASNILAYLSKMRHLTGLSKINPCIDFVMEFLGGTNRKLTIFVHHKDVGAILAMKLGSLCAELGLRAPLTLTADLDSDKRAALVNDFMNGDARILIASTLASGEGLNLQKCSDCIMLERQWNPANEEQAEGRFIRIGRTCSVCGEVDCRKHFGEDKITATYFVAVGTVDEFFSEIVEKKREIVIQTLGGEAPQWNESSLMKELAETLRLKGGKKWNL